MVKNNPSKVPLRLLLNPIHCISLGFGSGLSPVMPGTTGSLFGVALFLLIPVSRWEIYLGLIIVFFLAGIFICAATAKTMQTHDHPAIVWDEIVGVLIALFMVEKEPVWILTGFVLFRCLDILKPWPISIIDKQVKGGLGIMLDDVVAGIFAAIVIQLLLIFVRLI